MRSDDRDTYRRGARIVVPVFAVVVVYTLFRVWLIMRTPPIEVHLTLDVDALAPYMGHMVDVCEDAGLDSEACPRWLADQLRDGGT